MARHDRIQAVADDFVLYDLPRLPLHARMAIAIRLAAALEQAFHHECEAIRRELLDAFDQSPTANPQPERQTIHVSRR